jgi:hypothetical protein
VRDFLAEVIKISRFGVDPSGSALIARAVLYLLTMRL